MFMTKRNPYPLELFIQSSRMQMMKFQLGN